MTDRSTTTAPLLILHGGAGRAMSDGSRKEAVRASLARIADELYPALERGDGALDVATRGCRLLEDNPLFNAGTGSVLQADGQIRLSAALMDGHAQAFSGVINARRVRNPIHLAHALQRSPDRVLAAEGAQELARELGLPPYDPMVERRLKEWKIERRGGFEPEAARVVAEEVDLGAEPGHGTIGVVVLDARGRLAAGTSTGGRGFERIGRVSDSAMPAGNWADGLCAVSATGIGEHIIDEGLAVRIGVRVTDGATLEQALGTSFEEAASRGRTFGVIAVTARAAPGGPRIGWAKTSDILLAAWRGPRGTSGDTLDLPAGTQVGLA